MKTYQSQKEKNTESDEIESDGREDNGHSEPEPSTLYDQDYCLISVSGSNLITLRDLKDSVKDKAEVRFHVTAVESTRWGSTIFSFQ